MKDHLPGILALLESHPDGLSPAAIESHLKISRSTLARALKPALNEGQIVTNGSGGAITVTISDSGLTPAGNAATTTAVSVANGATKLFPLTAKTNSAATGLTTIAYSATSSVTAAVFRK